jgi:Tol biopolymer transport system component
MIFLACVSACANKTANDATGTCPSPAESYAVKRESFTTATGQGNGDSMAPSLSADGRFLAFQSAADNFIPGDTNRKIDIFVVDRQSGAISRASTSGDGIEPNGESTHPSLSADGRFVAFRSSATNLLPRTDHCSAGGCIFVKDRAMGLLSQIDVAFTGGASDGASTRPQINADGRFVAFESNATNLVSGDTNGKSDVFVRDLSTQTTVLASTVLGIQGNGDSGDPSISFDGRYVAFSSLADNLTSLGDTNDASDVFVRDLMSDITQPVSYTSTGQRGSVGNRASDAARISGDGRHVVFRSLATNFGWPLRDPIGAADTYVKDLDGSPTPLRASVPAVARETAGESHRQQAISFDGRWVAFVSSANLVLDDTNDGEDVFVRDRSLERTVRVGVRATCRQPNGGFPTLSFLSFDGSAQSAPSLLAYDSFASNIVDNDTNDAADVFTAVLP